MHEAVAAQVINAAVEGALDEAVAQQLISHVGGQIGIVFGREGKPNLRQRIGGFNNAARQAPWLVLVDLDYDADCAPSLRDAWLPDPAPHLCFRIAIHEVEAWLMADAETLAGYHLGVAPKSNSPDTRKYLELPEGRNGQFGSPLAPEGRS